MNVCLCVFIMYLFFFKHEKTTTHEYFEYKTKNQIDGDANDKQQRHRLFDKVTLWTMYVTE